MLAVSFHFFYKYCWALFCGTIKYLAFSIIFSGFVFELPKSESIIAFSLVVFGLTNEEKQFWGLYSIRSNLLGDFFAVADGIMYIYFSWWDLCTFQYLYCDILLLFFPWLWVTFFTYMHEIVLSQRLEGTLLQILEHCLSLCVSLCNFFLLSILYLSF